MKIPLTLLTLLPSIHAACYTPPQKRTPQSDTDTATDLTLSLLNDMLFNPQSGPSPITIDLPPSFLPPPWSPSSGLDSPYPSTGVSPWDDSGRSQMLDNTPLWRTCPRLHLDCRKCPRDFRCRRVTTKPESDGQEKCPLRKCDDELVFTQCGDGARCTRGYCVCDLGMKASGKAWRGHEGLEGLTVYADVGAACDEKCEDLSCKEVGQLEEGVCWKSGGDAGGVGVGYGGGDMEGVTYDNVGSGGQAG